MSQEKQGQLKVGSQDLEDPKEASAAMSSQGKGLTTVNGGALRIQTGRQ